MFNKLNKKIIFKTISCTVLLSFLLCSGCNKTDETNNSSIDNQELTQVQVIDFIESIDMTNVYSSSFVNCTLVSLNVDASQEYLAEEEMTLDQFYEETNMSIKFVSNKLNYDDDVYSDSDYIVDCPKVGVKYNLPWEPERYFSPNNQNILDDIQREIYQGTKFYLQNDNLVMVKNYGATSSIYNFAYEEIKNIYSYETSDNVYKIEHKNGVSIVLMGEFSSDYGHGTSTYYIGVDTATNKIDKFEIINCSELRWGSTEETTMQDRLVGADVDSNINDVEVIAGSTFSSKALLASVDELTKEYENEIMGNVNNKQKWKHYLTKSYEVTMEIHINKEGYVVLNDTYYKEEAYAIDKWCYTIERNTLDEIGDFE